MSSQDLRGSEGGGGDEGTLVLLLRHLLVFTGIRFHVNYPLSTPCEGVLADPGPGSVIRHGDPSLWKPTSPEGFVPTEINRTLPHRPSV